MIGIVGIITLLIVLGLSLLITRLATVALQLTGLSKDAARFQARSAFTGTGFTTQEAEQVVRHPVRRRIIMLLMILRSAGLITIIISLILSFGTESDSRLTRLAWLAGGVVILWVLASSNWVDRHVSGVMGWALNRWTDLDTRDYAKLLNLSGEYGVTEIEVRKNDWLADKTLREMRLNEEGVIVLGITRSDGAYVGAPQADITVSPGDRLVVYGRGHSLKELDTRGAGSPGESAHLRAVEEQAQQVAEQDHREQERAKERRGNQSSSKTEGEHDA